MKQKILIAEDNVSILTGLTDFLNSEGFEVLTATNGQKALNIYQKEKVDLLLLDIMMPEMSGYDVCKEIRKSNTSIKIIILTAKGEEIDKVVGLEMGADDYIVKPFSLKELLARVRAVLRRSASPEDSQDTAPFSFGDIKVDPKTLKGTKAKESFDLSSREIKLLQYFHSHEGEAIDRNDLLEKIWGLNYGGTTRTLDQHIAKLRQKIEDDPHNPQYIQTVHGTGYRFLSK